MSRPRTTKSATRIADDGHGGAAEKAAWKPSVSAAALRCPPRFVAVVEVATADSAAMPSAPPICWEVLIRPEARPASEGLTPASAAIEIGTNENPMPTAMTRNPGSRSPTYEPPRRPA